MSITINSFKVARPLLAMALMLGGICCLLVTAGARAEARWDSSPETRQEETGSTADHVAAARKVMTGDPEQALRHAQNAETMARRSKASARQKQDIALAFWLQAEALLRLNRPDEASPLVERAIILVGNRKTTEKLGGDLMLTQGRVAHDRGDVEEALRSFHDAHDIFAALNEPRSQAMALQSIGSIYADARDYGRVIDYYERSAEVYPDDPALGLSSASNLGTAYKNMGVYDKALINFAKALDIAEGVENPALISRIQTDIASVQMLKGDLAAAQERVEAAFAASGTAGTAGSAGLAPYLWGAQAQIDYARGEYARAEANIAKLFGDTPLDTTPMSYLDYHEQAAAIYEATGKFDLALAHLRAFRRLNDAALEASGSANIALMDAEFDFASQQLEIEKLKTGQLQRDMALAQARSRQQFIVAGFICLFGLVIAAALGLAYASIRRSRNSIRQANARLQRSHDEVTAANTALEKANNAKTEFLATTSHEIRTPLNGILGMTEVILKGSDMVPADRERVETVRKAGNALLLIVNDILDVAKIESGRMKVVSGPMNLAGTIKDTVDLWRENAEGKGLSVELAISDLPGMVEADEKYIRQIVFNLLSNAVKFTEKGAISITGWTDRQGKDETFSIEIRDSGIGIPEHERENIFKTFRQVDSGANRKYGGTGLGLSICLKLARLMDGDLTVDSTMGEGSVFTLTLPMRRIVTRPSPVISRSPTVAEEASANRLKDLDVLVAEDNKVNQIVIDSLLKGMVRSADIVDDGSAVLEALRVKQYDVILMDKQMPGMDGVKATQAIRQADKDWADTYIIAVTADAFEGAREELLTAGMDDYLSKPISQDALAVVLRRAIDRKLSHRAGTMETASPDLRSQALRA